MFTFEQMHSPKVHRLSLKRGSSRKGQSGASRIPARPLPKTCDSRINVFLTMPEERTGEQLVNPSERRQLALSTLSHRWAILLAGGEGQGMRPFVERWLGESRPKQYCSFYGERSMLEGTVRRPAELAAPEHILTVIGRGHSRFLREGALPGRVIEQPESLKTRNGSNDFSVTQHLNRLARFRTRGGSCHCPTYVHFEGSDGAISNQQEVLR